MAKRGRPFGSSAPNINVSVDEITKWAKTGATQADIANKLGISLATLERRLQQPKYRQALLIGKGELCISLRARQVQVALAGNVQMLKWLGENHLQQAHAHRFVDKQGEDKDMVTSVTLREWIKGAPPADGPPDDDE